MYDLIVIGAGWAGITAALTARTKGMKVALIERAQLGGTCLNQGCIPTKSLLQSAKVFSLFKKAKAFGIVVSGQEPSCNLEEIQNRKEKIILQLRRGLEFSLKGVDLIQSSARFLSKDTIEADGKEFTASATIIATGSVPVEIASLKFDGKKILSSDHIVNLRAAPRSLLIVGGGVIGCECAHLFSAFGSKVTIAELTGQLLPGEDKEIARKLESSFKKRGIQVLTQTDATSLSLSDFDTVLVCVGRRAQCESLAIEATGVKTRNGALAVDECMRTNVPTILAAGDCTGTVMLAHFAAYQGRVAAETILSATEAPCGAPPVPSCIYTEPEVASIGINEEKAAQVGMAVKVHKFDFLASGMARIVDETEGFVKILSAVDSGKVVGASLIGPKATELIASFSFAITAGLTVSQMKQAILPHPTLSEALSEALRA